MYNLIKIILFFLYTNRCNLINNKLDIIINLKYFYLYNFDELLFFRV